MTSLAITACTIAVYYSTAIAAQEPKLQTTQIIQAPSTARPAQKPKAEDTSKTRAPSTATPACKWPTTLQEVCVKSHEGPYDPKQFPQPLTNWVCDKFEWRCIK